jgi:ATP-binding cassette subfamily B protein
MVIIMFSINWRFALIAIGVIPPLFFLTRLSSKRLKKDWNQVKDDESLAMAVVHESLSALRVVKAFGQEENEQERFISQSDKAVKGQMKLAWIGSSFNFLTGMIFAVGTAFFIYFGARYVESGQMTLGELTLIMAYLAQLFTPLQSISKKINNLQSSFAGVERVFKLLDQDKEVIENPHALHLPKVKGSFEFTDVSFSYESDKSVLQNVTFKINGGDRVGIMGSTGAGKSTLISLIMRFYDISSGIILIDGEDIKKYKLADYRRQFSLVLQEPVLFSTSVGENIRYGRPGATEAEIIEAAIAANAHEFIMNSTEGYGTQVGERGMQLSGGERQRISLARAFIKNAPVLILDEPTSSVDLKTEGLIMEAMERLMKGRTTFMITHRLDTLSTCNLILHLEEGRLVDVLRDFDIDTLLKKKIAFINDPETSGKTEDK